MSEIRTYQDLLEEKKQLEAELMIRRDLIKKDVADLRQEWKPVTDLLSIVGKFNKNRTAHPVIGMGIDLISEVLIKKVMGPGGWILRLVAPWLAKNYSSSIIERFKKKRTDVQPIIYE